MTYFTGSPDQYFAHSLNEIRGKADTARTRVQQYHLAIRQQLNELRNNAALLSTPPQPLELDDEFLTALSLHAQLTPGLYRHTIELLRARNLMAQHTSSDGTPDLTILNNLIYQPEDASAIFHILIDAPAGTLCIAFQNEYLLTRDAAKHLIYRTHTDVWHRESMLTTMNVLELLRTFSAQWADMGWWPLSSYTPMRYDNTA